MAELALDVARKILDAALAKAVEKKFKPLVITVLDARGCVKVTAAQDGTSLVELMVGLTIGLIVILVVTQTLAIFEGQKRTTASGADAYRAGIGSGVGKALDRLAQYYIKLAEQTFPIIEVDAGREIDVVLTKGVRIDGSDPNTASNSSTSMPGRSDPAERYLKVTSDEE